MKHRMQKQKPLRVTDKQRQERETGHEETGHQEIRGDVRKLWWPEA